MIIQQLSNQARHELRNLREWVSRNPPISDLQREQARRKALKGRESHLSSEAHEAWVRMPSHELTEQLTREYLVKQDQSLGIILHERGGRYIFRGPTGEHDISSDPTITNEARVQAHWNGFCEIVRAKRAKPPEDQKAQREAELQSRREKIFVLGQFARSELIEAVRFAKDDLRPGQWKGVGNSLRRYQTREQKAEWFISGEYQVLMLDADGERIDDATMWYDKIPSNREMRKIFDDCPEAKTLVLESALYSLDTTLPLAERYEHREPNGEWWSVEIQRPTS